MPMEKFKHPEMPEENRPEKSKEEGDIYKRVEKVHEVDEETKAKLLESVHIAQVVAILQNMLQSDEVEGNIALSEYLDALEENQKELRKDKKYSDANNLETMEGIIRDGVSVGYLNPGMNIDEAIDAFSIRWTELQSELEKKGIKF